MAPRTRQEQLDILKSRSFWLVLAVAAYLAGQVMMPFIGSLLAAAVVVTLLWPVRKRVYARVPQPRLARALIMLGFIVFVFLPIALIVLLFIQKIPDMVVAKDVGDVADRVMRSIPPGLRKYVGSAIGASRGSAALNELSKGAVTWFTGHAGGIAQASGMTVLGIGIFFFAIWFFLDRGERLLVSLARISPLDPKLEKALFRSFEFYARTLVLGSFLISFLQMVMAMVAYAIVGVDEVLFLGVLTGIVGFVPVVGTALVWGVLALTLFADGATGSALFLTIWGSTLIAGMDWVVRLFLMRGGGGTEHLGTFVVFLSILGGFLWMGFWGLLLGPVSVSFLLSLLAAYDQEILGNSDAGVGAAISAMPPTQQQT